MRFALSAAAYLALILAGSPPAAAKAQAQETPPPSVGQGGALKPGDLVRLRIWREEDLSGEFQVNAAGIVVFPRLGEYDVNAETAEHLVTRLVVDYRRYLLNPSIEVTVLRRVNILGAVTKPGIYNVDPTVTIADALALAGGVTTIGNGERIQIIRNGLEVSNSVSQRTRIGDSPLESGDQIFVPERSLFQRNTALYATLISSAVTVAVALFLR
jgi:protein involved in polysaccharide export with SLBB domain